MAINVKMSNHLVRKYNIPGPRYTSYPTVPFWYALENTSSWTDTFRQNFHQQNKEGGISLYIHLPFCESLCTYCGCNKKITTNHSVEEVYISAVLKEWKFGDTKDSKLCCSMKDIFALPKIKEGKTVNLYYSSNELPNGRLLAILSTVNKSTVQP